MRFMNVVLTTARITTTPTTTITIGVDRRADE